MNAAISCLLIVMSCHHLGAATDEARTSNELDQRIWRSHIPHVVENEVEDIFDKFEEQDPTKFDAAPIDAFNWGDSNKGNKNNGGLIRSGNEACRYVPKCFERFGTTMCYPVKECTQAG